MQGILAEPVDKVFKTLVIRVRVILIMYLWFRLPRNLTLKKAPKAVAAEKSIAMIKQKELRHLQAMCMAAAHQLA